MNPYPKVAFLDIETRKVPCDYVMKNGEPLRRRWSAFAIGIGILETGAITLLHNDSELMLLPAASKLLRDNNIGRIIYVSRNKFDEMILKGRFTHARRGLEEKPFYTAMPFADDFVWNALNPKMMPARKAPENDIPSKDVPAVWERNGKGDREAVLSHLRADIEWMMNNG